MEFKEALKIFLLLKSPASLAPLTHRLRALGHAIATHEGSGSSAFLPAHRFKPDLIILDHSLPLESLRDALELQNEFPELPFVLFDPLTQRPTRHHVLCHLPRIFEAHDDVTLAWVLRQAISSSARFYQASRRGFQLEHVLNCLDEAILLSANDKIVWMNEAAANLLSIAGPAAMGYDTRDLLKFRFSSKEPFSLEQISESPQVALLQTVERESISVWVSQTKINPDGGSSNETLYRISRAKPPTPTDQGLLDEILEHPLPVWITTSSGEIVSRSASTNELLPSAFRKAQMQPALIIQYFSEEDFASFEEHWTLLERQQVGSFAFQSPAKREASLKLESLCLGEKWMHWIVELEHEVLHDEEHRKMERLDSLGLLARGFAHDFNNLLTVLSGNLALGQQRLANMGHFPNEFETASEATQEAQSLVQQLLTFASGGTPIKRKVDLHAFLQEFLNKHPRKPHIDYFLNLGQSEVSVEFDPNQIRRVISNLIKNSEQSIPSQGGMITLSCRVKTAQSFEDSNISHEVELQIRDTGEGISEEDLAHVFEPYFSTKQKMNASGLGLTVCESIIKAHGGQIRLNSYLGEETLVTFTLPAAVKKPNSSPITVTLASPKLPEFNRFPVESLSTSTAKPVAVKAAPRILLLDDEKGIRNVVRMTLATRGYELTETEDGIDTLRAYQNSLQEAKRFDLVILDLSVPMGMGGLQAMENLLHIDPNVKAIVSSGYSDDPVMSNPKKYGFTDVLPKPYLPHDLLKMVQKHLA